MKALALLSGGLDSTLAVKLILNQGIDVVAVNFSSPFCLCGKGGCGAVAMAQQLQIPVKVVMLGEAYLEIVRKPKHGYGKHMNPCIDCRIFMCQKALRYAQEIGAAFLFTGEVLDERPMSQHRKALAIIENEAGVEGRLLRPLSAKLLPETEPERKGWVDREKLLDLSGQSRKRQIKLAHEFDVHDYACPAGGCLLTYKGFAAKVRDLFLHNEKVGMRDVNLLKVGRHFRSGKNKLIIGRNEAENKQLARLKREDDYRLEVCGCGSPLTLLQGPKTDDAIRTAAALTLRYSDKEGTGRVKYGRAEMDKTVVVSVLNALKIEKLRIN